jgi:hypothetical protein
MSALMLTFVTAVGLAFFIAPEMARLTEKMKAVFPDQPLLIMDAWINGTYLAVTIQNSATVSVKITYITINDKPYALSIINLSPQEVKTLYLKGNYKKGETYTINVTTSYGKPLTITLKYK